MHVCIDGRSISHPRRGGFKTYIENLVSALAQLGENHRFTLIYDRPFSFAPIASHPCFEEAVLTAKAPMLGQVYREQIAIPAYARHRRGVMWHFPYNTAPVSGIERYILTLHDVTPFTHATRPDWTRPTHAVRELGLYYYPRLLMKRSAQRAHTILTVSHYAKSKIVELFAIPDDRVVVTPLAAQPLFRPFSSDEKTAARTEVAETHALRKPFLLTVASSFLKNPQGTLRAYASLSNDLKHAYDLVIVMAYSRFSAGIQALAHELGVAAQTHVLLDLKPEELLELYNLAELLVFPSFTESFGLPAAEAMACGTPIICSNSTGLSEQVGDAGIQVAPTDTGQISAAIARVLEHPDLSAQLRESSLQRSKTFSWLSTARQTINVFEDCVAANKTK